MFWATATTAPEDAALLEGSTRVHLVESAWIEQLRSTRVVAYRLPHEMFAPNPNVGGYWLSCEAVVPVELVELGDLVELHARSRIALRVVENLWPTWRCVVASSLEYSGIRLHNALPATPEP